MGFFSKIFNKYSSLKTTECLKLLELKNSLKEMFIQKNYISKKNYQNLVDEYKETINYFSVLKESKTLHSYCKKNNIDIKIVNQTLNFYENIDENIEHHNQLFIDKSLLEEKSYLDNILKDVDTNILLDNEQRKVVLCDEDYTMVIAGAGSGKTTTVAAKVKYLVEKRNIAPTQILVISFTNKAVEELKEKINKGLKIECPITTFHSTGNAILRKETPEKLNIVDSVKLYYVIQDYLKNNILKNESLTNNLILFFSSYFDAPFEGNDLNKFFNKIAKSNYATLRSDLDKFEKTIVDRRTKKKVTIRNEVVRSNEEVEIANFLYINNIEYDYEPVYKYNILLSKKPYTPDFILHQDNKKVYLEHFGISEDGQNNRYNYEELAKYKKAINDKILLHNKHKTKLIYTFSSYKDNRTRLEHLEEKLLEEGFILKPRSNKEIMQDLISAEENRYIKKLINLFTRFIHNFKTNGYTNEDFTRFYNTTKSPRTKLFLTICQDCYVEYEKYLKENNAVDFEDMINESARILLEVEEMKQKLDFKYIIVDEYQDISRQRFDLVKALSKVTDAKIVAVGDDWQSIYAFSGSDITLFTKFEEKMGYAKMLKIINTYRNSQEIIDIAGNFIQKNKEQITKSLKSPKTIKDPVVIYTYAASKKYTKGDKTSGVNYSLATAIQMALEDIIKYNAKENKPKDSSILLLGRYGFDAEHLERSDLFEYIRHGNKLRCLKYPFLNITFMTVHAAKGLGYDNVIVINAKNETYGFPSKIEDDPVLSLVVRDDKSIDYAEERRLFYVAMTRTKNRVFFIAPEYNPSEFLLEIKKDYKTVVLKNEWNEKSVHYNYTKKTCPICSYPLQYRYKNAYGLKLFICTNESEMCGFVTNEYSGGKLSIMKCDRCIDGYLIVKKGNKNGYFLGCTNYKSDKSGCNNRVSPEKYYKS